MEGKLTVEIQVCISRSVCQSVCLYDMIKWGLTSAQKEHKTYTNEDNDDVWENVCFFFCVSNKRRKNCNCLLLGVGFLAKLSYQSFYDSSTFWFVLLLLTLTQLSFEVIKQLLSFCLVNVTNLYLKSCPSTGDGLNDGLLPLKWHQMPHFSHFN